MKKHLLVIMTAAVVLCTPTSRERGIIYSSEGDSKGEIINKPVIQEILEMGKRYKNSST